MIQMQNHAERRRTTRRRRAFAVSRCFGGSKRRYAESATFLPQPCRGQNTPGANVKKKIPGASSFSHCYEIRRATVLYIRFDDNACVVINNDGSPVGTCIFGPVARELDKKYMKIVSPAPETLRLGRPPCSCPLRRATRSRLSGKDRGKQGIVLRALGEGKVAVEGVAIVKKAVKPNQQNQQGGIESSQRLRSTLLTSTCFAPSAVSALVGHEAGEPDGHKTKLRICKKRGHKF